MTELSNARRVIVRTYGGPEQLEIEEVTTPVPGPGQVLVDTEAAGVNYLDLSQRSGGSKVHQVILPLALGLEGVGRVRAVGDGAASEGLAVGARVAWIDVPGSYASQVIVPARRAVVVPETITTSQALLFQALTAQYLVHEYRSIRPGDRVLVHAAAGGVGQILVQWLKHVGAFVVGTVSSEAKAATVRALGADAVVVYGNDYRFLDEVMTLSDGKGVDLAFDGLGEKTLLNTIASLGRGGTVVAIGAASGPIPQVHPGQLTLRCLRLAGGSVFSYVADPTELRQRAAMVIAGIEAGWLQISDAAAYDLGRAADAHRDIESRRTQGKLYLTP